MCKNNTQCQAACVSELKKKLCPSGSKWANDHTCVKEHDCVCTTPSGIPVKVRIVRLIIKELELIFFCSPVLYTNRTIAKYANV